MANRGYRTAIDNLRERIENSEEISEADKELLLAFSDRMDLLQSRIGDARHKDLLGYCTRIGENVGGLADALEERDAAEEFNRLALEVELEATWTRNKYRVREEARPVTRRN